MEYLLLPWREKERASGEAYTATKGCNELHWHLQTQILMVDKKSGPDMTKSRGYNEDEARAAPKCWMEVEKLCVSGCS